MPNKTARNWPKKQVAQYNIMANKWNLTIYMANRSNKQAGSYLTAKNQDLRALTVKLKELAELTNKVSALLDPELAPYCQVANKVGDRLILLTANSSIATKLRFQSVELLRRLRDDPTFKGIRHIEGIVRPTKTQPRPLNTPQRKKMPPLSPETAAIVESLAQSLEDPKLRIIMERIAKRVK